MGTPGIEPRAAECVTRAPSIAAPSPIQQILGQSIGTKAKNAFFAVQKIYPDRKFLPIFIGHRSKELKEKKSHFFANDAIKATPFRIRKYRIKLLEGVILGVWEPRLMTIR